MDRIGAQSVDFRSSSYHSNLDVRFPNAPYFDGDELVLDFDFGRYTPSSTSNSVCWANTSLGVNYNNGIGYGVQTTAPNACADWGDPTKRDTLHRGFAPALMIASVGEHYTLNPTDRNSPAFDRHFDDSQHCSPQRMIKATYFEQYSVADLADALHGDSVQVTTSTGVSSLSTQTRADCSALNATKPIIGTYQRLGSGLAIDSLYNSNFPFAYASIPPAGFPTWAFRVDAMTDHNSANTQLCNSRHVVRGQLRGTLDAFGKCKAYVRNAQGTLTWDVALSSSTESAPQSTAYGGTDFSEVSIQSFPVCMQRFTASKTRSTAALSNLHEERVCTKVELRTKSTHAFVSKDVSIRTADLPRASAQKVVHIPIPVVNVQDIGVQDRPAPTAAPTPAPTGTPTAAPTPQPTGTPTAAPTPQPTATPTPPTAAPTKAPTAAPTPAPTGTPTAAPTKVPTPPLYSSVPQGRCNEAEAQAFPPGTFPGGCRSPTDFDCVAACYGIISCMAVIVSNDSARNCQQGYHYCELYTQCGHFHTTSEFTSHVPNYRVDYNVSTDEVLWIMAPYTRDGRGPPYIYTGTAPILPWGGSRRFLADGMHRRSSSPTYGDYLVHQECFEMCQRAYSTDCDGECFEECALVAYAPEHDVGYAPEVTLIPNAFGSIEILTRLEISRPHTGPNDELPFIAHARSFASVAPGVGAVNVHDIEVHAPNPGATCANGHIQILSDSTYSSLKIKSRIKRTIRVTRDGSYNRVNQAGHSHVSPFILRRVTVGTKQGYAWVQNALSTDPLVSDENAFGAHRLDDHSTTSKCASGQKFDAVHDSMPAAGTYRRGTDFAFQLQMGRCSVPTHGSRQCWHPSLHGEGCVVGEMKTVAFYLRYNVEQSYPNPIDVQTNFVSSIYQGVQSMVASSTVLPSFPTQTAALAHALRAKVYPGESLHFGNPYELLIDVINSPLSAHFTMQTQSAYVAVDTADCDPGTPASDGGCPAGYVIGRCGVRPDQSDAVQAMHALASVVLPEPDNQARPPVSSEVAAILRATPWYQRIDQTLATAGNHNSTNYCWGDEGAIGGQNVTAAHASLWCAADRAKSIWDGRLLMKLFLHQANVQTCSAGAAIWACSISHPHLACTKVAPSGALTSIYCLGGTPYSTDAQNFVYAFGEIPVMDEYVLQDRDIRTRGFLTYGDIGPECLHLSAVDTLTAYQSKVSNPTAARCGGMDRLISPSTELLLKMRGYSTHSYALAAQSELGDRAAAGRRQQCLASSRSTVTSERTTEQTMAQRSWLAASIYFGSAVAIPCVKQRVFMRLTLTDTRNQEVCRRASIACDSASGHLVATQLSAVTSGDVAFAPTPSTQYTLYRVDDRVPVLDRKNDACHYTGTHQYGTDTHACRPLSGVAVALVEGIDVEVCGATRTNTYTEQRHSSMYTGLRWGSAALEYVTPSATEAQVRSDVTLRNGRLLYVLPPGVGGSAHDLIPVTCGTSATDLLCKLESDNAANETRRSFGRRLFGRRLFGRRSTTPSDQPVVASYEIPPAGFVLETCATTARPDARCTPDRGFTQRSGAGGLACSAAPGGQCSHSYCCVRIGGNTTTTAIVESPCDTLGQRDADLRVAFVVCFSLGSFSAAILLSLMLFDVLLFTAPCGSSQICDALRRSDSHTWWPEVWLGEESALTLACMSIALEIVAAIISTTGRWVETCSVSNGTQWVTWMPWVIASCVTAAVTVPLIPTCVRTVLHGTGNTT